MEINTLEGDIIDYYKFDDINEWYTHSDESIVNQSEYDLKVRGIDGEGKFKVSFGGLSVGNNILENKYLYEIDYIDSLTQIRQKIENNGDGFLSHGTSLLSHNFTDVAVSTLKEFCKENGYRVSEFVTVFPKLQAVLVKNSEGLVEEQTADLKEILQVGSISLN